MTLSYFVIINYLGMSQDFFFIIYNILLGFFLMIINNYLLYKVLFKRRTITYYLQSVSYLYLFHFSSATSSYLGQLSILHFSQTFFLDSFKRNLLKMFR